MKTAYCRLCFAIFAIYVQRHTYVWYVFKMPLLWIDDNGYLWGDTKNRQRLNCCTGEHLIPYDQTKIHMYPLILWARQILIQARHHSIRCYYDIKWSVSDIHLLKTMKYQISSYFSTSAIAIWPFLVILYIDNKNHFGYKEIKFYLDIKISFRNIANRHWSHESISIKINNNWTTDVCKYHGV